MGKIKIQDVATNRSTSEPITLGCLCQVFVFLEVGYTLLLLPTSIPQNTDCSKPKVTHLFGSLHSSEKPRWSPWDSNALDWVSCRHCGHSTAAPADHLCSTQIWRAMLLCTPILCPEQACSQCRWAMGSSSVMATCTGAGPSPFCLGQARIPQSYVFTIDKEDDL